MNDLSYDEARDLTERIKAGVVELLPLIKEAFERRADKALGYESWGAYCDAELRGLRVPVEDRREPVAELRNAGMSTRAIGSALGIDARTVRRDLESGGADASPQDVVRGLDGGVYQSSRPLPPEVSAGIRDAQDEHEVAQQRKRRDREELDQLAGELGLEPDPEAEAEQERRTALLYPFFDAIHVIATMPHWEEVADLVEPYQQYRLDELPAAAAWLAEFARTWKEHT